MMEQILLIIKFIAHCILCMILVDIVVRSYSTAFMSKGNIAQKMFLTVSFMPILLMDKVVKVLSLVTFLYRKLIFILGGTSFEEFKCEVLDNLKSVNNDGK